VSKYCPECGGKHEWYEAECPTCHVALEEQTDESRPVPTPDSTLVVVLKTLDPALLPLAQIALDQAGIEYVVQNAGISDLTMGLRSSASIGRAQAPIELVVRAEDEDRARELLDELGTADATLSPPTHVEAPAAAAGTPEVSHGSVGLFDAETGASIGSVSESQFQRLADCLESESLDDDDYYIDGPTLTLLQDEHVDASVIELLRRALASRSGMDVRWARKHPSGD
jgi:hypothetical protein